MNDEVINQDEIDALLGQDDKGQDPSQPQSFDFINQEMVLQSRVPALTLIQETFIRALKSQTMEFVKRKASVEIIDRSVIKYDEYVKSQFNPTYLSLASIEPINGEILFGLDANLLFALVENYFGGEGKLSGKNEGRDFTPTELRLSNLYVDKIVSVYQKVWQEYGEIKIKKSKVETNPTMANYFPEKTLLVSYKFKITLEGGSGNLVISFPYQTMEMLNNLFEDKNKHKQEPMDSGWELAIKNECLTVPIKISCRLARQRMSLKDIFKLKAGDVIPIDLPELSVLTASGVPIFRGKFGIYDNTYAIKVLKKYAQED